MWHVSLRLPELEAVAFGVGGPAEAAVVVVFDLVVDAGAGGAELGEHGVEVADAVVEHAGGGGGGAEVGGVGGEGGPDGRFVGGSRFEGAVGLVRVEREAEVVAVPGGEGFGDAGFEEDAAEAEDAFHGGSRE